MTLRTNMTPRTKELPAVPTCGLRLREPPSACHGRGYPPVNEDARFLQLGR
jgi:hypothetical protein